MWKTAARRGLLETWRRWRTDRRLGRPLADFQLPLADIPILLAIFLVAGIAEEAGWTGYATDPLRERLSALRTALVVGAMWGLFHFVPDVDPGV